MINRIKNILNEFNEINDYIINILEDYDNELFFVKGKLETVRKINTISYQIKIYVIHDNYLGDAIINVFDSSTDEQIKEDIISSIKTCKNINNKIYKLNENIKSNDEIISNIKNHNLIDLANDISNTIFDLETDKEKINSLEIFIHKLKKHIISKNGLDRSELSYNYMIEAIPTYNGNKLGDSVELYEQINSNDINLDKIKEEIKFKLDLAKYRYEAKKPNFNNSLIALNDNEIYSLFEEIIQNLNYQTIYNQSNQLKIGDIICNNDNYDKITLKLLSKLKSSSLSSNFDNDGTTLKDVLLIDNGKIISSYGNKQYASYLNLEPTGNLNIIELNCGNKNIKDMNNYLELVSLSGLQVDLFNDYIGGEVRLALLHENDKITPYTSFSIQAKLSDVLNNLILSKEEIINNNYHGPKLLFSNCFKLI